MKSDIIFVYREESTGEETQGKLAATSGVALYTLELPDKGNAVGISRVNEGCYKYKKWYSPHFKMTVLRLYNVPGRTNILIHPVNYVKDLRGCIGAGKGKADINGDGVLDITRSRAAVKELVDSVSDEGIVCICNGMKV